MGYRLDRWVNVNWCWILVRQLIPVLIGQKNAVLQFNKSRYIVLQIPLQFVRIYANVCEKNGIKDKNILFYSIYR